MDQTAVPKGRGRLLIVDDEESIRDVLNRHFSAEGYECRSACDVPEAENRLRETAFDLVLTDILMPGESGLSLLKTVRDQFPETGVVMITAVGDTQVAIDAVKMGASDYITKPIDLGNTQILVEQALRRRELVLENIRYRTYLERLFQKYVSPEMLSYVLRHHALERLQSQMVEATVLFCDIRDFSLLTRNADPLALIARLNERYFQPATEIIMSKKGMVNKFLGDGIMAVFGAPLSYQGHAACAVEAARQILLELHQTPAGAGTGFPLGIGIASGRVLSGNVGGLKRMDYTVMGDAVNTAAHLEKIAGPGELLVDAAAFEALPDKPPARALQISLKGHENTQTVYRLGGEA